MSLRQSKRRASQRGVTLIEILVALAVAIMLSGIMFIGLGGLSSARLRESSTMIRGAVRIAYNHANATSRPTRVVFDIDKRTVTIEDSEGRMLLEHGDRTGGAKAANELEKQLQEEAAEIVEGPRAPRPQFQPVKKMLGFQDPDTGLAVRKLGDGIYFRQIEVGHEDEPVQEARVYLYFWPGGQTERAAIQLRQGNDDDVDDDEIMTISVSPLTGKVQVERGPIEMKRPTSDSEASEREDNL